MQQIPNYKDVNTYKIYMNNFKHPSILLATYSNLLDFLLIHFQNLTISMVFMKE